MIFGRHIICRKVVIAGLSIKWNKKIILNCRKKKFLARFNFILSEL